ncbi:cupin domain-containing protein [Flavobacterium agrisoli]|uniref:Cupin domain-containing protein n=1 Tax=Flavobacterium agrisoli TaxID=2793066 RepID=A0A934UJL6_9FLAO|nr:cupin domain-containing protein [Flavobacterium agrisoli]MBK0370096.1 cupin domain-containing protein [Flavobacterium agrisoli]
MKKSSFIEKGNPVPADYFVGDVNVNMLLDVADYNTIMAIVSFDAGARTNWHTHTNGQILIVSEGIGYYQEKGKEIQIIKVGDVVQIPENVEHWHGASHKTAMRHFAMIPDSATDKTEWLAPVTEKEYNSEIITD